MGAAGSSGSNELGLPGCAWLLECQILLSSPLLFPLFCSLPQWLNKTKLVGTSPSTKQWAASFVTCKWLCKYFDFFFYSLLGKIIFIMRCLFFSKIWLKFIPCQSVWVYQIRRKLGFIQSYLGFSFSFSLFYPSLPLLFHWEINSAFQVVRVIQAGNSRKTSATGKGISL